MRKELMAAAVVVAAVAVTVVAGCGTEDGTGVRTSAEAVVTGSPPATPYDGPLYVPHREVDEDSLRAMKTESGAAGRALECDGEMFSGGGGPGAWSEGDGGGTPREGLEAYFEIEQPDVPKDGYRVEREEEDRVLFSYDVQGRTKVAVIVAKDRKNAPGWGPETSASCDPAELPASFTDSQGYEVWTDENGDRVPISEVVTSEGPAHCEWQKAHFLHTGRDLEGDGKLYARDPERVLPDEMLMTPYDGDVTMPEEAKDTGYRLDDWELWFTDDTSTAYVRTADGVEAWPAVREESRCL
ncbi:hypothetical protein [Streptomyces spongiae]|uniref:Lipoprotein n=1 Tax=Streptomyces spongiae TaxID=565072 RepID=A0A5N8XD82_9ACTN|nr:hypothetical protein [Streptomyces spongiae]MPY57367.1 hypothetical protein [Streptomyces spongiae]